MINTDYHAHSNFSMDSSATMESMVRRAIELGMSELVLTDHQDYAPAHLEGGYAINFDQYMVVFNELKSRYANSIELLLGIEIGLVPSAKPDIDSLLGRYPFEFVIGSSHDSETDSFYLRTFFEGKTKEEAYTEYFELVLENILTIDAFDVYGHLDYIPRYGVYEDNSLYYHDYADIIDEILTQLIRAGKGLEVNTSGYRYGLNTIHPQPDILKRYRELGGEIITIGSDAHSPEYLGDGFDRAEAILKANGFTAYSLFRNRKPVWRDF